MSAYITMDTESNPYYTEKDGCLYDADCKNLITAMSIGRTLVLPNTVECIPAWSFYYCTQLVIITLPESLQVIHESAFYNCTNLAEIINHSSQDISFNSQIARDVLIIIDPDGTVHYRDNILLKDDFVFDEKNGTYRLRRYIGGSPTATLPMDFNGNDYILYMFDGAENVIIPYGKTTIDEDAFRASKSLKNIAIPETVTTIERTAFMGCKNLTSIVIPEGVSSLDYTFPGCINLRDVTLPSSLLYITSKTFDQTQYESDRGYWEKGHYYVDNLLMSVDSDVQYMDPKEGTWLVAWNISKHLKFSYASGSTDTETLGILRAVSPTTTDLPNLKNVIFSKDFVVNSFSYNQNNLMSSSRYKGCTFWVELPEKECHWEVIYPNWNYFDNKVYYLGEWSYSRFYDMDGNLIYSTPRKNSAVIFRPYYQPMDAQYEYVIGWDLDGDGLADIIPATSPDDIVAHAVIKSKTLRSYTVTFLNYDGTVLGSQSYPYGSTVQPPEDPVRESDDPRLAYEFAGWDRPIEPVTGDATYTATYTSRVLRAIGDVNGDDRINNKDARLLFQYVSNVQITGQSFYTDAADVNKDGKINNKDARMLFQYVSGVISSFG